MILLNDIVVSVQAGLAGGMAIAKFFDLLDWGWLTILSPFWIPWALWITLGVLYFPYWYFHRRNKQ